MKKTLISLVACVALGSLAMPNTAEAILAYEISNPIFGGVTYSPDANGPLGTTVVLGGSGSVTIGSPSTLEGGAQPAGVFGVGVPLAPLGLVPYYDLYFDLDFDTYDAENWDVFAAVVTETDYIWNCGTLVGGFEWGGDTEGGIEFNIGGWEKQVSVPVTPATNYFLNVVLDTGSSGKLHSGCDGDYPSWGTFSDVTVGIIPEPTSMLLLGIGLIGLAGGRVRKRFTA